MIGFVGLLSSATAIMIIVLFTVLVNVIDVTMRKELDKRLLQLNGAISPVTNDTNNQGAGVNAPVFIKKHLSNIQFHKDDIKGVVITCSYGKNISLRAARQLSVYNYLVVKNAVPGIEVSIATPKLSEFDINSCEAKIIKR